MFIKTEAGLSPLLLKNFKLKNLFKYPHDAIYIIIPAVLAG